MLKYFSNLNSLNDYLTKHGIIISYIIESVTFIIKLSTEIGIHNDNGQPTNLF